VIVECLVVDDGHLRYGRRISLLRGSRG
jgi:hypothetical protein